ncbi:hypothetical protein [Aurantimonas manganoxydans]|uniref:hypothetical protein n=1 Tax=Aurantimonas manganoxydans TaxID=651183 RepID=UPI000324E1CF|nr:hypothetical protein [Aurantimonas manganoxydans]
MKVGDDVSVLSKLTMQHGDEHSEIEPKLLRQKFRDTQQPVRTNLLFRRNDEMPDSMRSADGAGTPLIEVEVAFGSAENRNLFVLSAAENVSFKR